LSEPTKLGDGDRYSKYRMGSVWDKSIG